MTTPTLTEFLLARIAEDEKAARHSGADAMTGYRWKHYPKTAYDELQAATLDRCRRVLDECEAKRRIVEELCYVGGPGEPEWVPYDLDSQSILQLLAAPYANHPDFDEDWRT
jgi:hypothetical protein